MKKVITIFGSTSGVPAFTTGLDQSQITFVRSDNHSTAVDYDYFEELGNGQYKVGDFDIPDVALNTGTGQWNPAVVNVALKVNGTIQDGSDEIPVFNDNNTQVASQDLFVRIDKLGDTVLNWLTYDPSLSGVNGFDPFAVPNDAYKRFRVPSVGWVLDTVSAGFNGAYLPLTGGQLNGNVTANMAALTFVATNINGFGASANLKKISSSSMRIYNNLGTHPTGVHFSYGFLNTDAEDVPVMSMGCDDGEAPYINFHNRTVLGFNPTISLATYMPLTGGAFSGSVSAFVPRFPLGNTAFGSKGTSGEFANVTASGMTANNRGVHIKSNLGTVAGGDFLSVFYNDTNPDPHTPFRVGAHTSSELPYIFLDGELHSNQLTTDAPDTGATVGELSKTVYGSNDLTLTSPDKWLEIIDENGDTYRIPAFLKT